MTVFVVIELPGFVRDLAYRENRKPVCRYILKLTQAGAIGGFVIGDRKRNHGINAVL